MESTDSVFNIIWCSRHICIINDDQTKLYHLDAELEKLTTDPVVTDDSNKENEPPDDHK